MNDDALYRHWLELTWRRPLTQVEQAELQSWLANHPEAQANWELESGLNLVLEHLPQVPVPSNFTARVLAAAEIEQRAPTHASRFPGNFWPWQWRWLPRVAAVAVVSGVSLITAHHFYALRQERVQFARSVVAVAEVRSLPSPAILEHFDEIRALNQTPAPDEELLKLLQ
jgi:hypothetical protein